MSRRTDAPIVRPRRSPTARRAGRAWRACRTSPAERSANGGARRCAGPRRLEGVDAARTAGRCARADEPGAARLRARVAEEQRARLVQHLGVVRLPAPAAGWRIPD